MIPRLYVSPFVAHPFESRSKASWRFTWLHQLFVGLKHAIIHSAFYLTTEINYIPVNNSLATHNRWATSLYVSLMRYFRLNPLSNTAHTDLSACSSICDEGSLQSLA